VRKPKIGFASTDWSQSVQGKEGPVPGGANYVRIQQNRPHIGYNSVTGLLVHSESKGFGVIDWFGKAHYDCQIIVLQRLMFADLLDKLDTRRKFGQVFINDIDDWYWGLHEDNGAYKITHPDFNKDENIDHYKKIIQLSDAVVVSTPFLADKMKNEFKCKNVHLIENCVTTSDFTTRNLNLKKPVVGWVGSTNHRSGDLEIIAEVLQNNKRFKLHHSGHHDNAPWFADKIGVPREHVAKSPLLSPKLYAQHAFCFDVGVAPLNDIPFNHAKSWIKAIEYAAAGVPFVATDISEYKRLQNEYGIGRTASTLEEWSHHIEELCHPTVRNKEAKDQRVLVREHLDVHNMAQKWRGLLSLYL
jgi:glycosyltransferase involved in cell wall biosynthesis